jgi:hypothetical protein
MGGYAFVMLFRDADNAVGMARLLEDLRLPQPTVPSRFLVPPVRGVEFFSNPDVQTELDSWWQANVHRTTQPVFLCNGEQGLAQWIDSGVNGRFYVGVASEEEVAAYEQTDWVQIFICSYILDFATVVMRDFSGGFGHHLLFDEGEALRMAALSSDFPLDIDLSSPPPDVSPAALELIRHHQRVAASRERS